MKKAVFLFLASSLYTVIVRADEDLEHREDQGFISSLSDDDRKNSQDLNNDPDGRVIRDGLDEVDDKFSAKY